MFFVRAGRCPTPPVYRDREMADISVHRAFFDGHLLAPPLLPMDPLADELSLLLTRAFFSAVHPPAPFISKV